MAYKESWHCRIISKRLIGSNEDWAIDFVTNFDNHDLDDMVVFMQGTLHWDEIDSCQNSKWAV